MALFENSTVTKGKSKIVIIDTEGDEVGTVYPAQNVSIDVLSASMKEAGLSIVIKEAKADKLSVKLM